jgi:hypothetical protein
MFAANLVDVSKRKWEFGQVKLSFVLLIDPNIAEEKYVIARRLAQIYFCWGKSKFKV